MDIFKAICVALFPGAIIFLCMSLGLYFQFKEKVYRYPSNGWLDVKEYPIPEDIHDFLVTDGKHVILKYRPSWGPHGKVIFYSSDNSYVTHWQPLPEPPKN